MKSSPRPLWLQPDHLSALLLVILVATTAYYGTLSNFFSASDSLTLIETSRLQPGHDLADIFSEQMMKGTAFEGVFYRPISVLSFDLDYWLWRLDPFGYHLTNLLLHIMVTVMALLVGLQLTDDRLGVSLLAALLFACHPVLVETVPAIARRQDILEALFLLLSLSTYLRSQRTGSRVMAPLSAVFFVLALGAKETGIQIPGLIFAHALIYAAKPGRRASLRWRAALRITRPYLVITALYLVWRIHLLGGLGRDGADLPPLWIAAHFFAGLVYPQDFLGLRDSLMWLPTVAALVAVPAGVIFLVGVKGVARRRPEAMKLPLLLLVWVLLPLLILMVTGSFAYRSLYATVVPFSLLLSLVLGRGLAGFGWTGGRTGPGLPGLAIYRAARVVSLAGALLLSISLVAFSPLVRDYPLWRQSGQIARKILTAVEGQLPTDPTRTVISIDGLPQGPAPSLMAPHPRAHSVSYLRDYSIQSWLDLQGRGEQVIVQARNTRYLPITTGEMDLQIERTSPENVTFHVVWPAPAKSARDAQNP